MAGHDDVLELTLYPGSSHRSTRSNRETATRSVRSYGEIATWGRHRPPAIEIAIEVIIYEWKGEPLTGADPAQIGAYKPNGRPRSTHFYLHPEAFAEMWAALDPGEGRNSVEVTLELKTIDPDHFAVVEVTFVR